MSRSLSHKLVALLCGASLGCRAVLGIEEERPASEPTSPAPAAEAEQEAGTPAPPRFCDEATPRPVFCADFEGEVSAGFDNEGKRPNPGEQGGGTIVSDDVLFFAGTRSARFAVPPMVTDKSYASAFLVTELPSVPRYMVARMDLRIDTESIPEGRGRISLFNFNFGRDVGAIGVYRDAKGAALEVYDGMKSASRIPFTEVIPVGQWRTLSLLVHNYPGDGGAGEVIAVVGGVAAKLPLPAGFQESDTLPIMEVGAFTGRGPMDEFRVNIDNVRVTFDTGPRE